MLFTTIIFDLDGVIIDSIPVIEAAFQYACQQTYGPDVEHPPFSEYKKRLGQGFKVMCPFGKAA